MDWKKHLVAVSCAVDSDSAEIRQGILLDAQHVLSCLPDISKTWQAGQCHVRKVHSQPLAVDQITRIDQLSLLRLATPIQHTPLLYLPEDDRSISEDAVVHCSCILNEKIDSIDLDQLEDNKQLLLPRSGSVSLKLEQIGAPIWVENQLWGVVNNIDTTEQPAQLKLLPLAAFIHPLTNAIINSRRELASRFLWLNDYLHGINNRYQNMPTQTVLRILAPDDEQAADRLARTNIPVRGLYTPLHGLYQTSTASRHSHAGLQEAEPTEDRPRRVEQILANESRIILKGDPGTGKSTAMQHLALRLVDTLLEEASHDEKLYYPPTLAGAIPIIISFRDLVLSKSTASADDAQDTLALSTITDLIKNRIRQDCAFESSSEEQWSSDWRCLTGQGETFVPVVWIFDGFDECYLSHDQREQLSARLNDWIKRLGQGHCVCLTSRPYALNESLTTALPTVEIAALLPEAIAHFTQAFLQQFGPMAGPGTNVDYWQQRAMALNSYFEATHSVKELAQNPLMLTLLSALYCRESSDPERAPEPAAILPAERVDLYDKALNVILKRYEEKKGQGRKQQLVLLKECLNGCDETTQRQQLKNALKTLGFLVYSGHAHNAARLNQPQGLSISAQQILCAFQPYLTTPPGAQAVDDEAAARHPILQYLYEKTGLLVGDGPAHNPTGYRMIHRSFDEYLTAQYMVDLATLADFQMLRASLLEQADWWHEILKLAARYGDAKKSPGDLSTDLLSHLLYSITAGSPGPWAKPPEYLNAWLTLAQAESQRHTSFLSEQPQRQTLRTVLLEHLEPMLNHSEYPPPIRLRAGLILGHLGDPRPGTGVDPVTQLPDIVWTPIPAGEVALDGVDERFSIQAHGFLARYPLTNAQFDTFAQADDGYKNRQWWRGFEDQQALDDEQQPVDRLKYPRWPEANCPRIDITWYEAVAFCRWLTVKLRQCDLIVPQEEIRLPNEWEWQQAATAGQPSHLWPGGFKYEKDLPTDYANFAHDLGRTTPVGLFKYSRVVINRTDRHMLEDMAGNVWEWCLNSYGSPRQGWADELNRSNGRTFRGGSWFFSASWARAAYRGSCHPDRRSYHVGVRLFRDKRAVASHWASLGRSYSSPVCALNQRV